MSEVLVLVEQSDGIVKKVTTELLTLARTLGEPAAVWVGPGYSPAAQANLGEFGAVTVYVCLLYTSPSPRDRQKSRMPSSA